MAKQGPSIVVAGAGSIGCYAGGCLALAGRPVTLLARPRIAEALAGRGMHITDLDGRDRRADAARLRVETEPQAALPQADIILVAVKSGATEEMARLIAAHARPGVAVVSLQNGVDNPDVLRAALGARAKVFAGMVPFNVMQSEAADGAPRFHRATSGTVLVEAGPDSPAPLLDVEGFPVAAEPDMRGIAWGKLVLNLNNALNALSGLPLAEQLADRRWRVILAGQMGEALTAMRAAGVAPARIEGLRPSLLPKILKLPDWLFRLVAKRMLSVDPEARSSMWEDFLHRRPTEIDQLQGTIQRLAGKTATPVPLTDRIVALVREAEAAHAGSPRLPPEKISG